MKEASKTSNIVKNTFYLYLRSLFVLLVSLYTSRVVLRELGVDDFGIFNVVGGVVGMLEFIRATMQSTYQRYFNYEMGCSNYEKLKKIFSTSLSIQLILVTIFVIVSESIGLWFVYNKLLIPIDRVSAAIWVYHISIVSCALTFFSSPFLAAVTAYERMDVFAVISIVDALLKLVICYLLSICSYDKIILYSLLIFFINLLDLIMYIVYSLKRLEIVSLRFIWNIKDIRAMLSFSSWSLIDTISGTLKTQGLNVLLNVFFGPVVNAARGIAAQILNSVMQFTNSFQTAFKPQLVKSYANGNRQYMETLYYSATKISFFLMYILSMPLILETDSILKLWLGNNVPLHTIEFSRLVLITSWMGAFANPTSTIAYATGKIKIFSLTASLCNLFILPMSYVVLKLGGSPESSMIVSLIIAIITQIIRVVIVYKIADLSALIYFKKVIIPCLSSCFGSYFIVYFTTELFHASLFRIILTCIFTIVFSTIIIWICGLNKQEKKFILNIVHSKFNK